MSEEKKKQVIALGHFSWSLRRIEKATTVRRETAATYLEGGGHRGAFAERVVQESTRKTGQ